MFFIRQNLVKNKAEPNAAVSNKQPGFNLAGGIHFAIQFGQSLHTFHVLLIKIFNRSIVHQSKRVNKYICLPPVNFAAPLFRIQKIFSNTAPQIACSQRINIHLSVIRQLFFQFFYAESIFDNNEFADTRCERLLGTAI